MPASHGGASMSVSGAGQRPTRVRLAHVEWVQQRMTPRDWAILETVNRLRAVDGLQLERLHFAELSDASRPVVRGRVLRRLLDWRVLATLPRRVGGAGYGSTARVLGLDSTGVRLLTARLNARTGTAARVRFPGTPGERTVRHILAVAELYVQLTEQARRRGASVANFEAEPAAWWPNGLGGWLKPDAYVVLAAGDVRDHYWCEVDLATENIPTLKRKALTYLEFWQRGETGPEQITPRVVFSVPDKDRAAAVSSMLAHLPHPASELFLVSTSESTAHHLIQSLYE